MLGRFLDRIGAFLFRWTPTRIARHFPDAWKAALIRAALRTTFNVPRGGTLIITYNRPRPEGDTP